MTVEKQNYQDIVSSLDLGNPIAEYDNLLDEARVNTPTFDGVVQDKYDLVTGQKGAGKTAIFRILTVSLREYFLRRYNTVLLSGVNSEGDSVFNEFKERFESYTEEEFENFWKLYFITLVYNNFLKGSDFEKRLKNCQAEIEEFKRACAKAGIPNIPAKQKLTDMIKAVISAVDRIKRIKGNLGIDATNPQLALGSIDIELDKTDSKPEKDKVTIYVNEIGEALHKILLKSGYNVWIVLDRLDEVFDRYSIIEFRGLRGLLKAYRSFGGTVEPRSFKIKIFLRDDIMEFLTNNKVFRKYHPTKDIPPLPAATHMLAKESPLLTWTQDEIEKLILNRLLVSQKLREYVGINLGIGIGSRDKLEELLKTKKMREEYWYKIFPKKISKSSSLKWIYTRMRDSNGVVTPRSIIGMLAAATDHQKKQLQVDFKDSPHIFPEEAIKAGIVVASKSKLRADVYNEFPKEQSNIKKLGDYGKNRLGRSDLEKLFGKKWKDEVETLQRIGILKSIKATNEYMIVFLYRPALELLYQFG